MNEQAVQTALSLNNTMQIMIQPTFAAGQLTNREALIASPDVWHDYRIVISGNPKPEIGKGFDSRFPQNKLKSHEVWWSAAGQVLAVDQAGPSGATFEEFVEDVRLFRGMLEKPALMVGSYHYAASAVFQQSDRIASEIMSERLRLCPECRRHYGFSESYRIGFRQGHYDLYSGDESGARIVCISADSDADWALHWAAFDAAFDKPLLRLGRTRKQQWDKAQDNFSNIPVVAANPTFTREFGPPPAGKRRA